MKVYLGTLDRFGYTLTYIGKSKEETKKALLDEYVRVFKQENEMDPKLELTNYGHTFYEGAEEDLDITEFDMGKDRVMWL